MQSMPLLQSLGKVDQQSVHPSASQNVWLAAGGGVCATMRAGSCSCHASNLHNDNGGHMQQVKCEGSYSPVHSRGCRPESLSQHLDSSWT